VVCYNMMLCSMVQCEALWCGVVWCGVVWYGYHYRLLTFGFFVFHRFIGSENSDTYFKDTERSRVVSFNNGFN
jgi:hypothetical protein